jgi:Mrp family chromosome partitioning ATPase
MTTLVDYQELEQVYAQTQSRGLKTISVCASNSEEGVTTLACALAERYLRAGQNPLVVDMNFFKPSIHKNFLCSHVDDCTDTATQPDGKLTVYRHISGMNVMTATEADHPSLRQSDTFKRALAKWGQHYDVIIFDTSPLSAINRHNVAAEFICAHTEGVVMIIRSGVTPEADILESLSKLKDQNAQIVGLVMNDIECPVLEDELHRTIRRLDRYFPRIARKLARWVSKSPLLTVAL